MDEPGSFQTDLGAFDVSYDAGFATVSSSSSYTSQSSWTQWDTTGLIESLANYYGNYPRILSPVFSTTSDKAFTEELRFVSKNSGPWDWVAGSYYSHRKQTLNEVEPILGFASWSELPGTGNPPGCTVQSASCPYPTLAMSFSTTKGVSAPRLILIRTSTIRSTAMLPLRILHFSMRLPIISPTSGKRPPAHASSGSITIKI